MASQVIRRWLAIVGTLSLLGACATPSDRLFEAEERVSIRGVSISVPRGFHRVPHGAPCRNERQSQVDCVGLYFRNRNQLALAVEVHRFKTWYIDDIQLWKASTPLGELAQYHQYTDRTVSHDKSRLQKPLTIDGQRFLHLSTKRGELGLRYSVMAARVNDHYIVIRLQAAKNYRAADGYLKRLLKSVRIDEQQL